LRGKILMKLPSKMFVKPEKKILSVENIKKSVATVTDKVTDTVSEKIIDRAEQTVKQTASDIGDKISETVVDVKNKISEIEAERERKNFEKMNELRYNSAHLSDAQLRTFINDSSLDKFERIGYAAAFADRYSDRS